MPTHPSSQQPQPSKGGLPRPFVALCVAIGALVAAYCVLTLVSLAMASTEHRTRTFATAANQLHVNSGAADVRIVGERRPDVRVDMEIHRGMFRNGFQPRVEMRQRGRDLQLDSHCSLMAHVGVGDCGASYTVRVPRGTTLVVNADSGDVHVANLAGGVTVASASGDVQVDDVTGALQVTASSGDVHVDDVTGALQVTASSGDVHVAGYRGGELVADAQSGDVHVDALRAPSRLRIEVGSGDVHVAVPDVVYSVRVATGGGDRHVSVRQNTEAPRTIQASTSSGDVTIEPLG